MTLDLPRITVYFRVDSSDTVGNWATAEHGILVILMALNTYLSAYSWINQPAAYT